MKRALLLTVLLLVATSTLLLNAQPAEKVFRVGMIEELCRKVDGVLLESCDGQVKLQQIKPVIAAGKPVFIDKPMAANLSFPARSAEQCPLLVKLVASF